MIPSVTAGQPSRDTLPMNWKRRGPSRILKGFNNFQFIYRRVPRETALLHGRAALTPERVPRTKRHARERDRLRASERRRPRRNPVPRLLPLAPVPAQTPARRGGAARGAPGRRPEVHRLVGGLRGGVRGRAPFVVPAPRVLHHRGFPPAGVRGARPDRHVDRDGASLRGREDGLRRGAPVPRADRGEPRAAAAAPLGEPAPGPDLPPAAPPHPRRAAGALDAPPDRLRDVPLPRLGADPLRVDPRAVARPRGGQRRDLPHGGGALRLKDRLGFQPSGPIGGPILRWKRSTRSTSPRVRGSGATSTSARTSARSFRAGSSSGRAAAGATSARARSGYPAPRATTATSGRRAPAACSSISTNA